MDTINNQSNLWTIVYVSTATHLLSDDELEALLAASRSKNPARDITGILLYDDGNFMQVIEGPRQAAFDLYDRIQQDPLHTGLITLIEQPIKKRLFFEWAMEFRNLRNLSSEDLANASPYLEESLLSDAYIKEPNRSLKLLQTFLRLAKH